MNVGGRLQVEMWLNDEQLLVRGGSSDLFVYAHKCAPAAMRAVLSILRTQYYRSDVSPDFDLALAEYREIRRHNKVLDALTKIRKT